MANANPSSPGRVNDGKIERTINIKSDEKVGIREDGRTVRRTYMANGNHVDNYVFPGDFPDAKRFPKEKGEKESK